MKINRTRRSRTTRAFRSMPDLRPLVLVTSFVVFWCGCSSKQASKPVNPAATESHVQVESSTNQILIETPSAEFSVAPNGYVSATLRTSPKLSLDDPESDPGISVTTSGKEIRDFVFDVSHPVQSTPQGKLGERGKRIEIGGKSATSGLEATLAVEVYDDFPNVAL